MFNAIVRFSVKKKLFVALSSLTRSIEISQEAEKVLKETFPEVKHVVAKIGTGKDICHVVNKSDPILRPGMYIRAKVRK